MKIEQNRWTNGEICGTQVFDNSLVTTAVAFDSTQINGAQIRISDVKNSLEAGERLARSLDKEGLVHVFVLSDGLQINLRVGYGSLGGWDSFGPERLITRSSGNVLFTPGAKCELHNQTMTITTISER